MKLKKTVSPAVQQKNQNNSKKSTGPTSPQGKNRSRFNAAKHGLTARRLMITNDGKPVENGLAEIVEALRAHYGADDVVSEILIDNIALDYWRQNMGLEAEMYCLAKNDWAFHPQGSLPTIQRYNTTNQRALLKNLELLEKLQDKAKASEVGIAPGEYEDGHTSDGQEQTLQNNEESCPAVDSAVETYVGSESEEASGSALEDGDAAVPIRELGKSDGVIE
jgi:hypothetical protein